MIAAVILAAGRSRRMGRPKLNLPWGETTVIGRVVEVLLSAGVTEQVAVTGGARAEVEQALQPYPVRLVYNKLYAQEEMLTSFQIGLRALAESCDAALICLGDQPQIEKPIVVRILQEYRHSGRDLIVPSYQMRRGHPWLLGRRYFPEILAMGPGRTLRDFLNHNQEDIYYLSVDSPSILMDLDTPDAYLKMRPG